jgi:hypothetical protein
VIYGILVMMSKWVRNMAICIEDRLWYVVASIPVEFRCWLEVLHPGMKERRICHVSINWVERNYFLTPKDKSHKISQTYVDRRTVLITLPFS